MVLVLARMLAEGGTYDADAALRAHQFWLDSDPFDCGMTVRRQNFSDRKGLDLREQPAHLVSFKPPCSDGAAVGARSSFAA